jgi:hypothetical protein
VRRDELAGPDAHGRGRLQPGDQLPGAAEHGQPWSEIRRTAVEIHRGAELANKKDRVGAGRTVKRAGTVNHVPPARLEFPVAVEDLYPMVFPVRHVHPAVGVADDVVRQVEFAERHAVTAPGEKQCAVGRVLVHPRVPVSVADVDVPLGRQRRVGAAVEGQATVEGRGLAAWPAQPHQQAAVQRVPGHGVVSVIGAVEGLVCGEEDTVRVAEEPLPPGALDVAGRVEDDHGVLTPVEDEDPVVPVYRHAGHVAEVPALGQPRPVGNGFVGVRPRAELDRRWRLQIHDPPSFTYRRLNTVYKNWLAMSRRHRVTGSRDRSPGPGRPRRSAA